MKVKPTFAMIYLSGKCIFVRIEWRNIMIEVIELDKEAYWGKKFTLRYKTKD